jgi:hypothetical protein
LYKWIICFSDNTYTYIVYLILFSINRYRNYREVFNGRHFTIKSENGVHTMIIKDVEEGGDIYYDRFWETCFQNVGCDGTDISEDIDSEVRVYIQSVVPISLLYLCMKDLVLLVYIYINEINISTVLHHTLKNPFKGNLF